ncbi:MAG TPA: OsmC family protein [Candidatus Sulfotelmatobacter sp.]|nr:OsmC family protein [Candidatus Sulfotelmatobacter sp.]
MEVLIEHIGALQFQIHARRHTIDCDQPVENGGFDEGITPPELFLAALGSCAGFYAAQYLKKHNLLSEGTRIRVTAEKATDPARLDNFRIELDIPVPLSDEHRAGVETAVDHCLIKNTLLIPPRITLDIQSSVLAPV